MPTEVENYVQVRLALKRFAPDLSKQTQKEMANALRPVVARARGFIPADAQLLSGWVKSTASIDTTNYRAFPTFNSSDAKRGLGYRVTPSRPNKSGFVSLARIQQSNAGGAIYETAGRLNKNGKKQGPMVLRYLNGVYDQTTHTGKQYSKSLNPNAGQQFMESINSTGELVNARPKGMKGRPTRKQTGRALYRAWAEDNGVANAAVIKAIENSIANFVKATTYQPKAAA
jgi:hypothetical protein